MAQEKDSAAGPWERSEALGRPLFRELSASEPDSLETSEIESLCMDVDCEQMVGSGLVPSKWPDGYEQDLLDTCPWAWYMYV